jgi:cation transport regulator ChaC
VGTIPTTTSGLLNSGILIINLMSGATYIFGYGSLMNEANLKNRVPNARLLGYATLEGYKRSFNKPGSHHLYLNLIPDANSSTIGVIVEVDSEGLEILKQHEPGYVLTDVTTGIKSNAESVFDLPTSPILCFLAPADSPTNLTSIKKSYVDKCLDGLPEGMREEWLKNSEIADGVTIDQAS